MEQGFVDRVLFVVSPQNPFKKGQELLDAEKRIEIAAKAVAGDERMEVSDIELSMPRPSYTIDTLNQFSRLNPEECFALIMGEDNLKNFPMWKGYEAIHQKYSVQGEICDSRIRFVNAPLFPVSSTEIREKIKNGEDITPFVPAEVHDLVLNYYRQRW